MAVAVHGRVRARRGAAPEIKQPVAQPDLRPELAGQVVHHDDGEAQVLVVHHHLRHHRQHAQQQQERQLVEKQRLHVQADFVVEIALEGLNEQAARHYHGHEHHLHQPKRRQLAQKRHPVGYRHGIGNLGHAGLALAPHQLAAIKDDDGKQEQEKRPAGNAQVLVGEGEGRRVERFAGLRSRGQQHNHARARNGREVAAAHDAPKLQLGEAPPLAEAEAAREYLRHAGQQVQPAGPARARRIGRRQRARRNRRLAPHLLRYLFRSQRREPEPRVAKRQQPQPEAQPHRAVEQQVAGQRHQQRIFLRGREVAGG